MDIATLIGVLSGIGLVVGSILMNSGLDIFIDIPSLMIVVGGTIAATLINYPLKEFLKVMGLFGRVFMSKTTDPAKMINDIVELGNVAKKEGLLALEKSMKESKDEFLKKALQMTVDGLPVDVMEAQLKQEISVNRSNHKVGWEIMGAMGSFSPAFGMVGTLIGLIQMLADLSDPSTIGPKMAVAMITTFYGSLFANLFFIPMSGKLQRRSATETTQKTILFEGVIGIRNGENPKIMAERLSVYLEDVKKSKKKREIGEYSMSQDFDMEDDGGGGGEAGWLATYADLVTLLFAFFVLLFAMATVQEDKFEQLKKSLQESVGKQEVPEAGTREGLTMKDVESESEPDAVDELGGMIKQKEQEEMVSEIKEFIMFNKLNGKVSAENTDGGAVITLSDMLMFKVGAAEMKQEGKETLAKLAGILKQFKYKVEVVGHTDNIPVSSGNQYKSNWELSAARACDIVELLINEGIDPMYLTASGRASVEPITSNDTPEGRARNRRVEIIYERSKVTPDQIKEQSIENETK